jgi:hypothetical protein
MPFGKTKGTPLADLTDEQIQSALDWVTTTCPDKFADFQKEARALLTHDEPEPVYSGGPDDLDSSLPF